MPTVEPQDSKPKAGAQFAGGVFNGATSLQFKATALVVVLTLSVAGVVSGFLLQSTETLARGEDETRMLQLAAMLAKAGSSTISGGEPGALEALASEAADGQPLLYVIFSDPDGRQLAVAQDDRSEILQTLSGEVTGQAPVPGFPVSHVGTREIPVFHDVTYPMTVRADVEGRPATTLLGYVRTGMVARQWQRTMGSKIDMVTGVGILAVIAAIPLGFLLIRRIVLPLDGLAAVMHKFSQGDLHVRSATRRRDEIGRLSHSFNAMADQHQQTHERIVRLNEDLEKRVAQRTQQLNELASREPLTGLYNRRYFNEVLERCFSEAKRYQHDLTCVMLDLDGFKAVNDAFGHQAGDDVLLITARTIEAALRTSDVAARFGGDEFILLLPHTDGDDARSLSERITQAFSSEVAKRLPDGYVTMSVGIASTPAINAETAEHLIHAADEALYKAKAAGKDCIVIAMQQPAPTPS